MKRSILHDLVLCVQILVWGILVATIIYPALHEIGHILTTVLVGGTVVEYAILPEPYVICEVSDVSDFNRALIELGGMLFPLIISVFISRKNFFSWYVRFFIKFIGALSFMISIFSILQKEKGGVWETDDMVGVSEIWEYGNASLLAMLVIIVVIAIRSLLNEKPVERFMVKFDV